MKPFHIQHDIIRIETRGKGTVEITGRVSDILTSIGITEGVVTVFVRHTSCSLVIMENADPSARWDLHEFFDRLVPENTPWFQHTCEGPMTCPVTFAWHRTGSLWNTNMRALLCSGDWRRFPKRFSAGTTQVRLLIGHVRQAPADLTEKQVGVFIHPIRDRQDAPESIRQAQWSYRTSGTARITWLSGGDFRLRSCNTSCRADSPRCGPTAGLVQRPGKGMPGCGICCGPAAVLLVPDKVEITCPCCGRIMTFLHALRSRARPPPGVPSQTCLT